MNLRARDNIEWDAHALVSRRHRCARISGAGARISNILCHSCVCLCLRHEMIWVSAMWSLFFAFVSYRLVVGLWLRGNGKNFECWFHVQGVWAEVFWCFDGGPDKFVDENFDVQGAVGRKLHRAHV